MTKDSILASIRNEQIQVVDQKAWENWKSKNDDPYGSGIFEFAETWARLMQIELKNGHTIQGCAKLCSTDADIVLGGITGFMYGASVSILAQTWIHGEQLKKWHNTDYGQPDAKGTLNPAILTIK